MGVFSSTIHSSSSGGLILFGELLVLLLWCGGGGLGVVGVVGGGGGAARGREGICERGGYNRFLLSPVFFAAGWSFLLLGVASLCDPYASITVCLQLGPLEALLQSFVFAGLVVMNFFWSPPLDLMWPDLLCI
ncbi:hypothetical protein U1Q18_001435 [Sarracenia purpurea var. burkii]